jgi:hypothetical protein
MASRTLKWVITGDAKKLFEALKNIKEGDR